MDRSGGAGAVRVAYSVGGSSWGSKLHSNVRRGWRGLLGVVAVVTTSCGAATLPAAQVPEPGSLARPLPATAVQTAPVAAASQPSDAPIAPPPESMEGEATLREPPALLRSRPRGTAAGTWAVIIGVNDYPGTKYDLRSAVNDAVDVDTALSGLGVPADHRLLLTDGQVTRSTIQAAADWLVARAGPDAVAVFFFAGHVRKLAPGREAMIGADGRPVSDADLASSLSRLPARRAWIAIAACFGGGFTEVLRPGRVLTGAAPADQPAYENSAFARSYMVEFMVRQAIIERRAPESVQTAFAYAYETLREKHPNRLPVQFDELDAPLDLRPPGTPAPTRRRPPPPPPSSPPPSSGSGGSSGSAGSAGSGGSVGDDDEDDDGERPCAITLLCNR